MIVEFSNEVVNSVFVIGLSLCTETTVSLHRRNVLETIKLEDRANFSNRNTILIL